MKKRMSFVIMLTVFALGFVTLPAFAQKSLSGEDMKFLKKAASGGMMEVQMGQIAQEKGQSQDVKDFGSRMVTDHGKANDELKAVAQQKGVTLPTEMDKKHRSMVDKMKKMSKGDFDKHYMREMVKDHVKDVEKFRMANQMVKDPDLQGWATKTLPVLEQHLQQAKQIGQKLGVDVDKAENEGRKEAQKKMKEKK